MQLQLSVSVVDERWCPVRTKAGASTGEIRIRTLFREGKEDDLAEDEVRWLVRRARVRAGS